MARALSPQADVTREKAAYDISKKIVQSQGEFINSKTWWLVRDNLRGQAYNMKANMRAMNAVSSSPPASNKAYAAFWKKIDSLDLACKKKELALAQKEYAEALDLLKAYDATI